MNRNKPRAVVAACVILALLLAAAPVLMLPVQGAPLPYGRWSEGTNFDNDWLDAAIAAGVGDTVPIKTARELGAFSKLTASQKDGKTFQLTDNLDMSAHFWEPDATGDPGTGPADLDSADFTFDGDDGADGCYKISGLYVRKDDKDGAVDYVAFIPWMSGVLKNLTIEGRVTNGNPDDPNDGSHCGGLVGAASGKLLIENCTNKADVTAGAGNNVGGIIGYGGDELTMTKCRNEGRIESRGWAVGGLAGFVGDECKISRCVNKVASAGGEELPRTIYTDNADVNSIGGIVGEAWGSTLTNCINYSNINVDCMYKGGIVGLSRNNTTVISQCANFGDLIGYHVTSDNTGSGGILGFGDFDVEIERSFNIGDIDNGAGIVANVGFKTSLLNYSVSITDCYNQGKIKSDRKTILSMYGKATGIANMWSNSLRSQSGSKIENTYTYGEIVAGDAEDRISSVFNAGDTKPGTMESKFNYYRDQTEGTPSVYAACIGGGTLSNIPDSLIPLTSDAEAYKKETYKGFNFDAVWGIGSSFMTDADDVMGGPRFKKDNMNKDTPFLLWVLFGTGSGQPGDRFVIENGNDYANMLRLLAAGYSINLFRWDMPFDTFNINRIYTDISVNVLDELHSQVDPISSQQIFQDDEIKMAKYELCRVDGPDVYDLDVDTGEATICKAGQGIILAIRQPLNEDDFVDDDVDFEDFIEDHPGFAEKKAFIIRLT
ncbi:MAG: hypothetical protein FWD16_03105, partial [Clostridia bacterium]|nr:hypothetical protein [Clostridia bacterium]